MLSRVDSPLSDEIEDVIYRVIGCALEVHTRLGPGFVEAVYHKALRLELAHQGMSYTSEQLVTLTYRDTPLHDHRIDLIVEGVVLVEVKAVQRLDPIHRSQVVSYLRATKLPVGLLINFNTDWLKGSIKRVVV